MQGVRLILVGVEPPRMQDSRSETERIDPGAIVAALIHLEMCNEELNAIRTPARAIGRLFQVDELVVPIERDVLIGNLPRTRVQ